MKNKQFKYSIALSALITISSVVPITYGYNRENVETNVQEINKLGDIELIAKSIKLQVGEVLDHAKLSEIISAPMLEIPEGYSYQAEMLKGSELFEDFVAVREGQGYFRINLLDDQGQVIAKSKECIKVIICKKTDEVITSVVAHRPYIQGYEDGSFRADQAVTREEFATMVSRLMLKGTLPNYDEMYEDLDEYRYSTEHIEYLASQGIITGYQDGMFMPGVGITRAEAAHVIDRVLGKLSGRLYMDYQDVDDSHWAYEGIMRVTSRGYMQGSTSDDGKVHFRPNEHLTRAEAVLMLNKVFDRECNDVTITHNYTDLSAQHWAYKQILTASVYHEHVIKNNNN